MFGCRAAAEVHTRHGVRGLLLLLLLLQAASRGKRLITGFQKGSGQTFLFIEVP